MKKFLMVCTGIILTGTGFGIAVWHIRKKPASVEIIGGADGPTTIFLAGKFGKKKRRRY
ncbi:MAG: hypothetical protein Q4E89_02710 [Eubacteriales bacterium]|nr:hypothetical protein [Eubacteriales bacterium]